MYVCMYVCMYITVSACGCECFVFILKGNNPPVIFYNQSTIFIAIMIIIVVKWAVLFLQEVVRNMKPDVITPGNALRLRATQALQTQSGDERATGEEWLIREIGAYLAGVFEEVSWVTRLLTHRQPHSLSLLFTVQVVSMEEAVTLTPKVALHILALDSYTDQFGRKRYACIVLFTLSFFL